MWLDVSFRVHVHSPVVRTIVGKAVHLRPHVVRRFDLAAEEYVYPLRSPRVRALTWCACCRKGLVIHFQLSTACCTCLNSVVARSTDLHTLCKVDMVVASGKPTLLRSRARVQQLALALHPSTGSRFILQANRSHAQHGDYAKLVMLRRCPLVVLPAPCGLGPLAPADQEWSEASSR